MQLIHTDPYLLLFINLIKSGTNENLYRLSLQFEASAHTHYAGHDHPKITVIKLVMVYHHIIFACITHNKSNIVQVKCTHLLQIKRKWKCISCSMCFSL